MRYTQRDPPSGGLPQFYGCSLANGVQLCEGCVPRLERWLRQLVATACQRLSQRVALLGVTPAGRTTHERSSKGEDAML